MQEPPFILPLKIPRIEPPIHLSDPVVSLGSCFSQHMGTYLADHKFSVLSNPAGTLFHPMSVHRWLSPPPGWLDEHRIVYDQDVAKHYSVHSDLSAMKQEELIQRITSNQKATVKAVSEAKWLLLTYGSAFAYLHTGLQEWVANCHKQPDRFFERILWTPAELIEEATSFFDLLFERNPHLNVLLTVSPVRHLRDGLVANNQSKANLIQLVHQLVDSYDRVQYFPAYEILIDQLRDYRFYASDGIHPSEEAIRYIQDQFTHTCLSEESRTFIKKWSTIRSALAHRPMHRSSAAYRHFIEQTLAQLDELTNHVDVADERQTLLNLLDPEIG